MSATPTSNPRVMCFVDGFNLYHSVKAAERALPGTQLKWLNIPALSSSFMHVIGGGAQMTATHYFTAYADHLRPQYPDKIRNHRALVRALTATGANAHVSHFQQKQVWSHDANRWVKVYEEKETDVLLACTVLKRAFRDELDVALLMTGDTDFVPLVREFREIFPAKRILFAFPFARSNKQLEQLCPDSFKISKESYRRHQYPDAVRLPSGKFVTIPNAWKGHRS
ncbi:MAG: uncharacterized LabA/DUF88 family protein [Candidatus Binatia bacterium]|jgi:uncharacterized LabA/DUF88 family protein